MTFPVVTEIQKPLEPVSRDTFADAPDRAAAVAREAAWVWPSRRPADA
jgi:hypothetical protein